MKKIIIFIIIVLLVIGGYYWYQNYYDKGIPVLEVEKEHASISEYYIYGNTLNMVGSVKNVDTRYSSVDLVLYNGEFKSIDIVPKKEINNLSFYITEEINNGYYLDDIDVGEYFMFLRFTYEDNDNEKNKSKKKDKDNNKSYKYYVLDNDTDYKKSSYYTVSTYNNIIEINSDNDYKTMMFNVIKNNEKEVYDVVIDPGHGGEDGGTTVGKTYEKDLTMAIANKVKDKLKDAGYKVKLTRKDNQFTDSEYFEEYNVTGVDYTGRAIIPQEVHAKYVVSLHVNSSNASYVNGMELYAPDNINYDLAQLFIDSIMKNTDIGLSNNTTNRISPGIYVHNFNEVEIANAKARYDRLKYKHYELLSTKSNYLYMIRETGGYLTGAYVDDSNPDTVGVNPYYKSNVGVEAYLIELGYLTNSGDFDKLTNKQDEYATAIADTLIYKLKNEK